MYLCQDSEGVRGPTMLILICFNGTVRMGIGHIFGPLHLN